MSNVGNDLNGQMIRKQPSAATGLQGAHNGEMQPPLRRTFVSIEEALAMEKQKSIRGTVRAFMPLHDEVLVLRCEPDELSETGLIVIPEAGQEKPPEGIILAVGGGRIDANCIFHPTMVEPGDRVIYRKFAGHEYTLRGRKCQLMRETDLLGVIR